MNIRILTPALVVLMIGAASLSRPTAEAASASEDKCEEAIAQKMKAAEKLKKISFVNNTRSTIPHGRLTHYAGKGFYALPGGGKAEFGWFCDIIGATGKPENLYYEVVKPSAAPKEKEEKEVSAVADNTPAQECQDAVASEIKKKKSQASDLAFSPPNQSHAGKEGKLLEAEGSFKDERGQDMKFDYRCIYDGEKRKITSSFFRLK
jgi:hypothetical protein